MQAHITPVPPDEDLAAAVLAAVALCLEAEGAAEAATPRPAWQAAAVLAAHGLPPTRGAAPSWASADRAGRAGRWSAGMLGTFD